MKNFYVWTHYEAAPRIIIAENKKRAIAAAMLLPSPTIPARDIAGYYGDEETHFVPARICKPIEAPYACTVPKSNRRSY